MLVANNDCLLFLKKSYLKDINQLKYADLQISANPQQLLAIQVSYSITDDNIY